MAIAGLVLGIISLVLCWVPVVGPFLAVLGIIFSAVGLAGKKRKGISIGGLVTSIIGLIVGVIITIAMLLAPNTMKWVNNSRNATDQSNYDSLFSAASIAIANENVFNEVRKGNEIIIIMTSSGVEIMQNDGRLSSEHPFVKTMIEVLGSEFPDSMRLRGSSKNTPMITVKKDGSIERTVEPKG